MDITISVNINCSLIVLLLLMEIFNASKIAIEAYVKAMLSVG